MSSQLLLSVKWFSNEELMMDENESRLVLRFFWPHSSSRIHSMEMNHDARRLAQSALIAAIDGSYAMGFVKSIFLASARPNAAIKLIARKFAQGALRHHFKHARSRDLEDVEIYEVVRIELAGSLRERFWEVANGLPLARQIRLIHLNSPVSA
ncbi:hypothetical protein [Pseudothauera lacus]|uniref:Uncharacterized protein n=1 Tax=Pseudothauera lacus TaxID=2136175 RepID=A0A2T4IJM9_9RHOO|nr:hypothetical protein [Pseudothauera lacus]PTD97952.1 hypothetical protein C8261_00580 [Pseudothauera lacus]